MLQPNYNNTEIDHPVVIESPEVWNQSRFFSKLDPELTKNVLEKGYMDYWHNWGIDYQVLQEDKYKHLLDEFLLVGYSRTGANHDGRKFVTLVEHKKYPIYGTQFHSHKS